MQRLSGIVTIILFSPLHCTIQAQQNPGSVPTPSEDRSPYLGRPVVHPEALSGIWETSNGHGGAVGIHLELDTMIPGDGEKSSWVPQSWQDLQVGVFERKGAEIQFGEEGFFSDSRRGGSLTFDAGRLQLHFVSQWADVQSVDLDLVQQGGDCWYGRLHRGTFDSRVTVCRPTAGQSGNTSPIVGTWSEISGFGQGCIHIAQQAAGKFTGWSDSIEPPGTVRCASTIPGPHALFQHFGELMKIHLEDGGIVSFELYAYTPLCCSHTFVGKITKDGALIHGTWPPGANQAPHDASWKKLPGDSCVTSSPAR